MPRAVHGSTGAGVTEISTCYTFHFRLNLPSSFFTAYAIHQHGPRVCGTALGAKNLDHDRMASPEARERFARKNEEDDLRRAFDFLDRKKDGKIDEDDLTQVFMSLQHRTKKGEINDMIWEVDEDCDNAVNWKACFARSATSTANMAGMDDVTYLHEENITCTHIDKHVYYPYYW